MAHSFFFLTGFVGGLLCMTEACAFGNSNPCCICQSSLSEFQKKVYHATAKIQQGKVTTYGELAKALNSAPRAVGQALKRNPFNDDSFIPRVPCHRVISQDFTLGGKTDPSSSQIQKKLQLLESEGFEFRDFKLIESMQERVLRYNDLKNLR